MAYTYEEACRASQVYFDGDELAARVWVNKYALKGAEGQVKENTPESMLRVLADELEQAGKTKKGRLKADEIYQQLSAFFHQRRTQAANVAFTMAEISGKPNVTEVRPQVLECDVVRFQNNKEKWVALVGLLDGYPYEIFTGLQDDDEGIVLPKSVTKGRILKQVNPDGTKRYDFQFTNTRGYKITVEGLSEKFNPEYWNYAKLISGVLRYRMPIEHVIKLVGSLQLKDESINTWKNGVERALKKYLGGDGVENGDVECPQCGHIGLVTEDGFQVCKNCGYRNAVD
jgi:hypothetical protein